MGRLHPRLFGFSVSALSVYTSCSGQLRAMCCSCSGDAVSSRRGPDGEGDAFGCWTTPLPSRRRPDGEGDAAPLPRQAPSFLSAYPWSITAPSSFPLGEASLTTHRITGPPLGLVGPPAASQALLTLMPSFLSCPPSCHRGHLLPLRPSFLSLRPPAASQALLPLLPSLLSCSSCLLLPLALGHHP